MHRQWGTGASSGSLVRLTTEADLRRVGNCWLQGRLRVGDVLMCVEHTGDHFYDYIPVQIGGNFVNGLPEHRLGAYVLGEPLKWQPSSKEFHLLCAGENVFTDAPWEELSALNQEIREKANAERLREVLAAGKGDILGISQGLSDSVLGVVMSNTLRNAKAIKAGTAALTLQVAGKVVQLSSEQAEGAWMVQACA